MRALLFPLPAIVALSSCTTAQIRPAPGAQLAPLGVATATASGIQVWVDGTAWHGYPSELGEMLTPIYVAIENHSGRAVRVQNGEFELVGASGFRYAPISVLSSSPKSAPPQPNALPNPPGPPAPPAPPAPPKPPDAQIDSSVLDVDWHSPSDAALPNYQLAVAVRARGYVHPNHYGFHPIFRPHLYFYWGAPYWWYPYGYWYGYPYPYYQAPLPTQDMVNQALPEGTIDDGGRVAGFLYFQRIVGRETQLKFEARLPDANSGETIATISIPLVVTR